MHASDLISKGPYRSTPNDMAHSFKVVVVPAAAMRVSCRIDSNRCVTGGLCGFGVVCFGFDI